MKARKVKITQAGLGEIIKAITLAAVVLSVGSLLVIGVLVHQNPPPAINTSESNTPQTTVTPATEEEDQLKAAQDGIQKGYEKGMRMREHLDGIQIGALGTICKETDAGFVVRTEDDLTTFYKTMLQFQRAGADPRIFTEYNKTEILTLLASERAFTIDCRDIVQIVQQTGDIKTGRKIEIMIVKATDPSRMKGWTMVDFFVASHE